MGGVERADGPGYEQIACYPAFQADLLAPDVFERFCRDISAFYRKFAGRKIKPTDLTDISIEIGRLGKAYPEELYREIIIKAFEGIERMYIAGG